MGDEKLMAHTQEASLIAVAPKLLETCKLAFGNLNRRSETRKHWSVNDQLVFEALEEVIAKAEGRS